MLPNLGLPLMSQRPLHITGNSNSTIINLRPERKTHQAQLRCAQWTYRRPFSGFPGPDILGRADIGRSHLGSGALNNLFILCLYDKLENCSISSSGHESRGIAHRMLERVRLIKHCSMRALLEGVQKLHVLPRNLSHGKSGKPHDIVFVKKKEA